MEYKELLTWLARFFTVWNKKHAPANQVNRLRIEMSHNGIDYVFNGQVLCSIEVQKAAAIHATSGEDATSAEKKLLLSILETTSDLATSPQLRRVSNLAERREIIILLLRLYHALEEEISSLFPEVRILFNRKYFQQSGADQEKRNWLMMQVECFRDDLLGEIRGEEEAIRKVEQRERYIAEMSIAELCILLNAVIIISNTDDRQKNISVAAWLVKQLVL